jgi:sulfur-carrier protein
MPSVEIVVPANWRTVAGHELGRLSCDADTVGAALQWLIAEHPQFSNRLFDGGGRLASWINIYLGEENIRDLSSLDTAIPTDLTLVVVPAMAGG